MPSSTSSFRFRRVAILLAITAGACVVLAAPLGALADRAEGPRAAAEPPPELLSGVTITGATVDTPGAPTRTLDANQATAFMQAWLPDSVFTKLPNTNPPSSLPVSHLTVGSVWRTTKYPLKVLYATNGKTAWVGMPPQSFGWASVPGLRWIAAPQSAKVRQAFAGKLQPVRPPAEPSTSTPSSPTSGPKTTASHSSGSNTTGWVIGGVILVVGVTALVLFTRRRKPADAGPGSGR